MNIESYLKNLRQMGSAEYDVPKSRYNPQNLTFDRVNYDFSKFEGKVFVLKGSEKNNPKAREKEISNLKIQFLRLKKNRNSPLLAISYAEEILKNNYPEVSELLLGHSLSIIEYPLAFHLLARIHLDYYLTEKFPHHLPKKDIMVLSEILAERGLEAIDKLVAPLIGDVLDCAKLRGNSKRVTDMQARLGFHFSASQIERDIKYRDDDLSEIIRG